MHARSRIVLVEDRPFAGMSLERLLTLYGFPATVPGDYERAAATIDEDPETWSIVLVDLTDRRDDYLAFRARLEASGGLERVRPVAFARLDRYHPRQFDGLGLEAVVDANALPEELLFRINEAGFGGHEARRYIRAYTDLDATCTVGARSFQGRITNLGKGGAFVQTDEPVEDDAPVSIRFSLPSGEIASDGRVCFRAAHEPIGGSIRLSGFGVAFTELAGEGTERVAHFVAERQSEWRALLGEG